MAVGSVNASLMRHAADPQTGDQTGRQVALAMKHQFSSFIMVHDSLLPIEVL